MDYEMGQRLDLMMIEITRIREALEVLVKEMLDEANQDGGETDEQSKREQAGENWDLEPEPEPEPRPATQREPKAPRFTSKS